MRLVLAAALTLCLKPIASAQDYLGSFLGAESYGRQLERSQGPAGRHRPEYERRVERDGRASADRWPRRTPINWASKTATALAADVFAPMNREPAMDYRTATALDLTAIFRDLSLRIADQYSAAGLNIEDAKDEFLMSLKEGRAHTLLQDGKPLAIVAWREVGDTAQTAFAAHESFFSRSTVRFCKQHIRRIQALCGNLPVDSYSWSSRPEVAKWFRVLGFRERERGNGFTVFQLDPA
jgi:hypothetical protein